MINSTKERIVGSCSGETYYRLRPVRKSPTPSGECEDVLDLQSLKLNWRVMRPRGERNRIGYNKVEKPSYILLEPIYGPHEPTDEDFDPRVELRIFLADREKLDRKISAVSAEVMFRRERGEMLPRPLIRLLVRYGRSHVLSSAS